MIDHSMGMKLLVGATGAPAGQIVVWQHVEVPVSHASAPRACMHCMYG